jgi:hypothetical protein
MTKEERDKLIRLISSPPKGSKIAAAKEFGVDLTILVRMLELTPTVRLKKLADAQAFTHKLQTAREAEGRMQKAVSAELEPRNGLELILKILSDAEVRFVMVGDLVATAYGPAHTSHVLELCYDRGRDNIDGLAKVLEPFHPRLRVHPDDQPFHFDPATIAREMNFPLTTDIGEVDLLGEVSGIGGYEDAKALSITLDLFGFPCAVLSLEGLIRCKRASARPKDLLMLPELEALREMQAPDQAKP